ncbi:MAG: NYN domain-containing protein, partial [Oscillospiraceae bacterium]|nr:NYN domain-containing protein [Oscillospiraceae bacterium]
MDAGKTTLCETMMYAAGIISAPGSVDQRSSNFDTNSIERQRGITVFSAQAMIPWRSTDFYIIDTPGHSDLAAEAERNLPVLDYAVVVISGSAGVQAHTLTIWSLLEKYRIPTFLFISKMDLRDTNKQEVLQNLRARLSDSCFELDQSADYESISMASEEAMEEYLETETLSDDCICRLIRERKLFPCFFGSGLKNQGVEEFLDGLERFTIPQPYPSDFSARVYRVSRDTKGERLTWLKITGGELAVREPVEYSGPDGEVLREKVNQLRFYNGLRFETAEKAAAGQVCAVTGLSQTLPGMGIQIENSAPPELVPIINYRLLLDRKEDPRTVYRKILVLQEEDPMLRISWNEEKQEISVFLSGRIQREVFCALLKERFDLDVQVDAGTIVYKETIAEPVEGIGHFEPLRHYAEVHLILEPLPEGSGMQYGSICSEDFLDRNWQNLILTHLMEKKHRGVLTGAELTDVRISIASGRAHVKHTEGGDFRQATYRAVRQGLMQAKSILLEPYVHFEIAIPTEMMGRIISDLKMMGVEFDSPVSQGQTTLITGAGPAASLCGYAEKMPEISRGLGRMEYAFEAYKPCRNQDKVAAEFGYDPEADLENTPDSVFCSHGAGMTVKWNRVDDYMHLDRVLGAEKEEKHAAPVLRYSSSADFDDKELERMMMREFGPIRRPVYSAPKINAAPKEPRNLSTHGKYVIVDGYNVLYAWKSTKELAKENLDLARNMLIDQLYGFAEYTGVSVVLIFDA